MDGDKCLICENEKNIYPLKCKMCGMGMKHAHCIHRGFVFCSIKCRDIFARMMEDADEKGRRELEEMAVVF